MSEIGKDIIKAKQLLEKGNLVAIPTETVYGLAGNALNPTAVVKIFTVKNRPQFDPLIVHVSNLDQAKNFVESIPEKATKLAELFWPGPLTLLLKKKPIIPDLVTAGMDTVGIRCPDHALTQSLLQSLPFPLAAPSANPFGYVSPTQPSHVNDQLGNLIDYILDGGACKVGIESTIVGFENEEAIVFRLGGLSIEAIEREIGDVTIQLNSSSNPKAPGQLKSHYAPQKKMVIGNLPNLIKKYYAAKVGILAFSRNMDGIEPEHQIILSKSQNMEEAAQRLFSALRELDKKEIEIILAEWVPEIGLGKAINDRLNRAAAH
ncbi:MAG: threonylcarbamoyl-AMP synthase [Cyclobacteriaceae bacterium]|nr:threonylcarbamoyl-AMP synthase [Cyclobacteriaceae bacterium]